MTPVERRWTRTDALFVALIITSILPAVLVRYPLSADYLNHLARLHILGSSPDAPIRHYYEIHWSLIPNLALDLLWEVLQRVASPEAVTKGALIGATIALVLSVWFLHRSIFARTQPTILLCALCLWNLPVAAGFINFAMGLPLIFLALGCWIRLGETAGARSLLLLNLLGAAAYFAHIAALAALILTVATYHCLQLPRNPRAVLTRALQITPGFLLPTLLVIGGAVTAWRGGTAHADATIAFESAKLLGPLAAFFSGYRPADLVTLYATAAIVILCRGPISPRFRPVLAIWILVIVALPSSIDTAVLIDARLAVIPVLLFLCSIAYQPPKLVPRPTFAIVVASLVILRVAMLVPVWQLHDAHVRGFRAIVDRVPRGTRVIVGWASSGCGGDRSWDLLEEHLPSLLSIDRDAFVSTVFAGAGMQPIRWKSSLPGTGRPTVGALPLTVLEKIDSPEGKAQLAQDSPNISHLAESYEGWLDRYDYLALRDCVPQRKAPPHLSLVARSDTYRIYQIVRSPPRAPISLQTAYNR